MTAVELIRHLQLEADELRKQKKRQNVSGLHKSVRLRTPVQHELCLCLEQCSERSSLVDCRLELRQELKPMCRTTLYMKVVHKTSV